MKWLQNFSLVVRSSVNAIIERVEDPERMLNQLIIDMEEELESVRGSVAEAMADEFRLGREAAEARKEAAEWGHGAGESVRRGEERTARASIEKRLTAEKRALALEESHARQKKDVSKLEDRLRDLDGKIEEARQKRTLLVARLATAESEQKVQRALDRAGDRSAFAQFRRLEDRVEHTEALAEAHARLSGRDPETEDLRRELEAKAREEQVEKELEALKRRGEHGENSERGERGEHSEAGRSQN